MARAGRQHGADHQQRRVLRAEDVRALVPRLAGMTAVERSKIPGVSEGRSEQMVAGAIVAEAAMDLLALSPRPTAVLVDNNIGVGTYIHDDAQKVLDMLGEDPSPENVDKLYGDMTVGHGGYDGVWFITSHEWSMRNAPKDVTKLARKASERYVEEDETAVPTIIVS